MTKEIMTSSQLAPLLSHQHPKKTELALYTLNLNKYMQRMINHRLSVIAMKSYSPYRILVYIIYL